VAAVNFFGALLAITSITSREFWSERKTLIRNPLVIVVLFMYVLMFVGVFYSTGSNYEALNTLNRYKKILLLPLLIPHFQRQEHKLMAIRIFAMTIFCNVLLSWSEFYGFTHISDPIYGEPPGNGVFRWHITQGLLFSLLIAITTGLYLSTENFLEKLICIGVAALTTANIAWVMDGRNGKAAIPVLIIWAFFEYFRIKPISKKKTLLFFSLVVMVTITATTTMVMNPHTRLGSIVQELRETRQSGSMTSQGGRVEFWRKGLVLFVARPLTGYGTGSVYFETKRLAASATTEVGRIAAFHLHNEFLMWAVQFGIFGLSGIILFFYLWFRASFMVSNMLGIQIRGQWCIFATGCLYNTYLVDFTEGFSMVVLMGVLIPLTMSGSKSKNFIN
jgi:O-antigen ligase